jgi:Sec-independent protein secretion pathway component TatC
MFFSVYPLYEASIWIIRRMEKNRPAEDDDTEDEAKAE